MVLRAVGKTSNAELLAGGPGRSRSPHGAGGASNQGGHEPCRRDMSLLLFNHETVAGALKKPMTNQGSSSVLCTEQMTYTIIN
jgi:hypothetical protein